jgi:hypothetical protein
VVDTLIPPEELMEVDVMPEEVRVVEPELSPGSIA